MKTAGYIALAFAVVIGLSIVGFALRWAAQPIQVLSPENVREQWRFAYEYIESLQAIARQVCSTEKALSQAESETERIQRRSQLLAYEQNFARVKAEFDARLRNAFEGRIVAPPDVPRRAPTLEQVKANVCGGN